MLSRLLLLLKVRVRECTRRLVVLNDVQRARLGWHDCHHPRVPGQLAIRARRTVSRSLGSVIQHDGAVDCFTISLRCSSVRV